MLKSTPPMSDHERFIYERATANIRNHVTETIWEDELHWRTQPYLCFQRLSASSLTALVARRHEDGEPFRDNAFEALGIERQACPPSKTVILLREGARSRCVVVLAVLAARRLLAHPLSCAQVDPQFAQGARADESPRAARRPPGDDHRREHVRPADVTLQFDRSPRRLALVATAQPLIYAKQRRGGSPTLYIVSLLT